MSLRFLHCLKKSEYLLAALTHGLMLTNHNVSFSLSEHNNDTANALNEIIPLLKSKLISLGRTLDSLTSTEETVIFGGMGKYSGSIPMLCATEVPTGREIATHRSQFGNYGIVISREWLEKNGADRVIYIGDGTPMARAIFKMIATMKIGGLKISRKSPQLLFDNDYLSPSLDFLAHVEIRRHMHEAEWRIAGRHGFMGGGSDKGKILPLPFEAIEHVLVPEQELSSLKASIAAIADSKESTLVPTISTFKDQLPAY